MFETVFIPYISLSTFVSLLILKDAWHGIYFIYTYIYFVYI